MKSLVLHQQLLAWVRELSSHIQLPEHLKCSGPTDLWVVRLLRNFGIKDDKISCVFKGKKFLYLRRLFKLMRYSLLKVDRKRYLRFLRTILKVIARGKKPFYDLVRYGSMTDKSRKNSYFYPLKIDSDLEELIVKIRPFLKGELFTLNEVVTVKERVQLDRQQFDPLEYRMSRLQDFDIVYHSLDPLFVQQQVERWSEVTSDLRNRMMPLGYSDSKFQSYLASLMKSDDCPDNVKSLVKETYEFSQTTLAYLDHEILGTIRTVCLMFKYTGKLEPFLKFKFKTQNLLEEVRELLVSSCKTPRKLT